MKGKHKQGRYIASENFLYLINLDNFLFLGIYLSINLLIYIDVHVHITGFVWNRYFIQPETGTIPKACRRGIVSVEGWINGLFHSQPVYNYIDINRHVLL